MNYTNEQARAFQNYTGLKGDVECTKKLMNVLGLGKNEEVYTYEPLEARPDLIIKEWTSKKGEDYVMVRNMCGSDTQLRKDSIKNLCS